MTAGLRLSLYIGIFLVPQTLSFAQGLLTGPVVNNTPQETNPVRGAFKMVGNIGVSVVDTLAQTTRFTSNIFRLDIEGALNNVGDVFSKRSVDDAIVQVIENLPEVLDQNLHLQYKPSSKHALKDFFRDKNLDVKETAALFSYILQSNGNSPKEAQKIASELRETMRVMRQGAGNKSAKQLGRELANSMRTAISAAPKPMPILGNPLNATRQLSITKGFFHSIVQTQAVPFARGTLAPGLAQAKAAGVEVKGLTDGLLRATIDNVFDNLEFRSCLEKASSADALIDCAKRLEQNQNRAVGSAFETLSPSLKSGKFSITLQNKQFDGKINISEHLARALAANAKEVQTLRRTGRAESLNVILNSAISSATREVGGKVLNENLAQHFSESPEMLNRVVEHGQTLVDSFSSRLRLLKGGDGIVKQIENLMKGGTQIEDNKILDAKLRGPFRETFADPQAKAALFGIFVEKLPIIDEAKQELLSGYTRALKSKPLKFTGAIPDGMQEFLKSFDASIASVADVPSGTTLVKHLKSIVDPESMMLNQLVLGFQPGAMGLFKHYLSCSKISVLCSSLISPYSEQLDILREAEAGIKGKSFEAACRDKTPVLLEELFRGVGDMKENITKKPLDAILALASDKSQTSLDCVLSGLAAAKGLPSSESERLHRALSDSRVKNLQDREELVQALHGYLGSPLAGGAEQKRLLASVEKLSKDVVSTFAVDYVDEFTHSSESKLHQLLRSPENSRITTDLIHRMIDNTDLIDQDTKVPLQDYAKRLTDAPLRSGSDFDRAVHEGLKKTLADPATRRDVLSLALGMDSTLIEDEEGFLGAGLERRLVEAYAGAELKGGTPVFQSHVSPGLQSILKSFDSSVRGLIERRAPNESLLEFLSNLTAPESRLADSLIADQAKGVSDLLMSTLSCRTGKSDLCGACLGTKGSWIISDPKSGTSEVLFNAPMGHLMGILKMGLRPSLNAKMTATCQAAIPATIERIVAQPKLNPGARGVLEDPALFLDALALPVNQTALNCIVANYSEHNFLQPIRSKYVGIEGGVRSLLSHVGVPEDVALFELSGERFFETLEKRNANPELLQRKSDLIAQLRKSLSGDTGAVRHEMAIAAKNLTRSLLVGTLADPDMAHGLANGRRFSPTLRTWAEGNALAREAMSCMDRHYSAGLLPIALYASEDLSSSINSSLRPWVEKGSGGRKVSSASPVLPGADDPESDEPVEACASVSPILAGLLESSGLQDGKGSAASSGSSEFPQMWGGGYEHTLRDFQALNRAEYSPVLSPAGSKDTLGHTADYQKLLNHLRSRGALVGRDKGFINRLGDTLFEAQNAGPEGLRALKHLKDTVDFPADKLMGMLQEHKDRPSSRSDSNLRKFIRSNCAESLANWTTSAKPRSSINEAGVSSHE